MAWGSSWAGDGGGDGGGGRGLEGAEGGDRVGGREALLTRAVQPQVRFLIGLRVCG